MMTGKQMSLTMLPSRIAPPAAHGGRPAILSLLARLLAPADPVGARLRQAQASLAAAVHSSSLPPTQSGAHRDIV